MTYFGFLLLFLGVPILGLLVLTAWDRRKNRLLPEFRRGIPAGVTLLIHVLVAVLYTTLWDNYLVATGVWFYNPELVTGITLGWVPLEEYTFFILQTLMTGLWFLLLARRVPQRKDLRHAGWRYRIVPTIFLGITWALSLFLFLSGWKPGTYYGLIILWALPPIMLQFFFGGDILWREKKIVGLTIFTATLYLSITDSLAIGSGTWTIDPMQSLNIFLGGILPLEELIFFLVTNCLIVFGMTLFLAKESRDRFESMIRKNRKLNE